MCLQLPDRRLLTIFYSELAHWHAIQLATLWRSFCSDMYVSVRCVLSIMYAATDKLRPNIDVYYLNFADDNIWNKVAGRRTLGERTFVKWADSWIFPPQCMARMSSRSFKQQ
jgi:hypothetical protein